MLQAAGIRELFLIFQIFYIQLHTTYILKINLFLKQKSFALEFILFLI